MRREAGIFGMVLVGALMLVSPVFAQGMEGKGPMGKMGKMGKMSPEEMEKQQQARIEQRVAQLTKDLNLTAEQQTQVRDIMMATGAEIKKMMEESRAKVKELLENDRASIKALLTPEQQTLLEERRQGMGQGSPEGGAQE